MDPSIKLQSKACLARNGVSGAQGLACISETAELLSASWASGDASAHALSRHLWLLVSAPSVLWWPCTMLAAAAACAHAAVCG